MPLRRAWLTHLAALGGSSLWGPDRGCQYLIDWPPSIGSTVAFTYEASSYSRNATTDAISFASP